MTTRIDTRFADLACEGRPAFVTFVMAGDPDLATPQLPGTSAYREHHDRQLESVMAILRATLAQEIVLEFLLPPTLRRVKADPTQLHQILINLCVNARDAITGVGVIRIETARVDRRPPGGHDCGSRRTTVAPRPPPPPPRRHAHRLRSPPPRRGTPLEEL